MVTSKLDMNSLICNATFILCFRYSEFFPFHPKIACAAAFPASNYSTSNYSIVSCLQTGFHPYDNPIDENPSFCEDDQCYDIIDSIIHRPLLANVDGAVASLPVTDI